MNLVLRRRELPFIRTMLHLPAGQCVPAVVLAIVIGWIIPGSVVFGAEESTFYRGLNLNGGAVTIDGYEWEGRDAKYYECLDNAFESQNVPLVPPTDDDRATMIRSSRWGGNRIELREIPDGTYTVFLYVWEDNHAETYSISLNDRKVVPRYNSGVMGHWERLGPWYVQPVDHKIVLTSSGGAANFSGIEVWRGRNDGTIHESISDEDLAFFEKRIRPVLVDRCYECHSESSGEAEGGLLVDSRPTLRLGGAGGPAIVPKNAKASLLLKAIEYSDDGLQMPPDEPLGDEVIADFRDWIERGAPDPRAKPTRSLGKQIDIAEARKFWSLQPLERPNIPEIAAVDAQWSKHPIDLFIAAKMQAGGLRPAEQADKRTLIRRLTYDLTGLPPTSSEALLFIHDSSPTAWMKLVDRLLASPAYGERWGRHWLDVVRFADTAGDNSDFPIPQVHRYRDWVIDAFNRDLPYDEFVRDQLSGDLRGAETVAERSERLIATGYIAGARRFGSRVDDYPQHLTIEDTIDNLGRTFLGLTLSCARCHDHKFDPITTRDYYAIYGIFHSTRYPWPGIELDQHQRDLVPLVPLDDRLATEAAIRDQKNELGNVTSDLDKLIKEQKDAPKNKRSEFDDRIRELESKRDHLVSALAKHDLAYSVVDADQVEDVAVQMKGDPTKLGDVEPRRFLSVLGGQTLGDECRTSGRDELAEWILSSDNPLSARVMANRIWQHHFGRGIVPTPNDFGKQGKPPTHPELLDYLACELRDNAWSIKSLHRMIVSSSVYQQSSHRDDEAIAADPTNQWLASFPRQRLDAEQIRDTLLMLGDNLDTTVAGEHPFPPESSWKFTQHNPFKAVYENRHRSVYLMTQRIQRHPYLAIFDGADPSTSTPARMTSTTPLQALFLLNDPLVHEQAERIAKQLQSLTVSSPDKVNVGYEMLFSRQATEAEVEAAVDFLDRADSLLHPKSIKAVQSGAEHASHEAWCAYVRSLLRLNEFVYLD